MDNLYKDSIDNPATALDFAIRDAQNEYECGYEIPGKEPYYNYLSNLEWCKFKKSMSALHSIRRNTKMQMEENSMRRIAGMECYLLKWPRSVLPAD